MESPGCQNPLHFLLEKKEKKSLHVATFLSLMCKVEHRWQSWRIKSCSTQLEAYPVCAMSAFICPQRGSGVTWSKRRRGQTSAHRQAFWSLVCFLVAFPPQLPRFITLKVTQHPGLNTHLQTTRVSSRSNRSLLCWQKMKRSLLTVDV